MPTPMFKVLAQSLRLGQPPDGASALRVLVEAIEKQSAEIEDLRAKLAIASSRMHYAEARLGRILEATEPDLAREEAPPSSHHGQGQAQGAAPGPQSHVQSLPDSGRGSQRPPPMAPKSTPPPAMPRSASVRPQSIPHSLPIPQAPLMPHGLTNPHTPLSIPQPMPLPQAPSAPAPAAAAPAVPRPPGVPTFGQKPPVLQDLVDDHGFDEFNQTLVINKRDVLQVAHAEAPFPLSRGPERQRATTAGTPFLQPPMQPAPQQPGAQTAPQSVPQPMLPIQPAIPQPMQASRQNTPQSVQPAIPQPQPLQPSIPQPMQLQPIRQNTPLPLPVVQSVPQSVSQPVRPVRPAQDGTKTGIHPHRPTLEESIQSQQFAAAIDAGPPLLASIIDEADGDGASDDFTLTDQTARVDLSGLTELEQQAASRQRLDHDGD